MSEQTRVSHPIYSLSDPRTSRDSIPWPSLPWICAGRGIMPPTKCGGSLIPRCGNSRITLGLSCRRSRGTRLERVLADPAFRKNVDDLVQARRQAAEAPAWFQQTSSADLP